MMKNQLAGLMKQAQQMQDNLKRAQEELARTEVEGQAGAGLVKILMTCRYDVRRVSIDPSRTRRSCSVDSTPGEYPSMPGSRRLAAVRPTGLRVPGRAPDRSATSDRSRV